MLSVGPEKAIDLIDLRIQTQSAAAMFSMKVYTVLQSTAAPRTKTVNRAEVWFGARTVSLFWLVVVFVTLGSGNSQKNSKYQKTTTHSQNCNEQT